MRSSRRSEHGFNDPFQREPTIPISPTLLATACAAPAGLSQFGRLTEAWLHRLFSLVLFEALH